MPTTFNLPLQMPKWANSVALYSRMRWKTCSIHFVPSNLNWEYSVRFGGECCVTWIRKFPLPIACVASVSNRVIARKVERKQKKGWRHSFFFCSCPSFLDEPREETLASQATLTMMCKLSYVIKPFLEEVASFGQCCTCVLCIISRQTAVDFARLR